jgi:CheY-like chemotaxis protein
MSSPAASAVKPRILIADDSTLVRAVLIKHVEEWFEFREALDGEEAWQLLLTDPQIHIVITDLTMPKLDGYGLLQRIRTSEIEHIRTMPVIVVSGSDQHEERERAKAAGAADVITKSIDTTQLLSRLEVLSKLAHGEPGEHGHDLKLAQSLPAADIPSNIKVPLLLLESFTQQASNMLEKAYQSNKNFALLTIALGLPGTLPILPPPISTINTVSQLLQDSVRQTDYLTQTGIAEFSIATGSIHFDSARRFAQRLYRVITRINLVNHAEDELLVSCGLVAVSDYTDQICPEFPPLTEFCKMMRSPMHN